MKYLRKYNTFEEYNTDKNNLPSPSIAYVLSTNTIYYNGDGYNNQSAIADGDTIIYNTDLIYLKKDGNIYPVSHPDLSTQPSILPQRYGNLDIKEVLIANGREDEIPLDATIIEAFSFNKKECVSAICMKGSNKWSITNTEEIIPEFTLVRYVGDDLGYYYEEEGDNNLKHDYSKQYLTFEALQDGTFRFTKAVNYSTDDGATWTELAAETDTPTITSGNKIMWKAELTPTVYGIGTFSSTGNFNVEGNAMSLLYGNNFIGQTDLTSKDYAFHYLFLDCSKLINAENLSLPATTLANYCYQDMFYDCTALTTAPELPAILLEPACYTSMFSDCTALTTAPKLPATTLANDCYTSMFRGCIALTTVPELPAITLANNCYVNMFSGCTSLTTAPELPATTLANYCYSGMFSNCTSLTTAPELPATTLITGCYNSIFQGCTSLNFIRAMFTTTPSTTYTYNWVSGVAANGTFNKNLNATWDVTGVNGVPTGWTIEYGDLNKYLTFKALQNGTFQFTNPIRYSIDNGTTWGILAANTATPTITAGSRIIWKAELTPSASTPFGIGTFSSTGNFNVEGNPMSLLYGDNFIGQTNLTGKNYAFCRLFNNCSNLINAEYLSLPATTLATYCYYDMFRGCTSLKTAPELPATTLTYHCYYYMFKDCISLATAPELPATTLTDYCYNSMFTGCTSLTTAPLLPATTLAYACYSSMFNACKSLTTAPELPATTLAIYCYSNMFSSCTALTTAPELPATTLVDQCYNLMFSNCSSLTTAPLLPATTLAYACYSQMFYKCTSLTTAPELPATTLATYCYSNMFGNCTSLTTAPELPAITLVEGCYHHMFEGCTNLNYIKALFTTTPSVTYTESWVYRVAAIGVFVKNSAATWTTIGTSSIPTSWTVHTASS